MTGGAPLTDQQHADIRQRLAAAFEREDAQHWGYDHGFSADLDQCPETAAFVDVALAVVQPELDRLRAELADTARFRDFHQRSAGHIAHKRDRAEQLIGRYRNGNIDAENVIDRIARALSAEGDDAPLPPAAVPEPAHQSPSCPDPIECDHEAAVGQLRAENDRLRATLAAIESDAERAARKGYDLDAEDIRAAAHKALTAAAPSA